MIRIFKLLIPVLLVTACGIRSSKIDYKENSNSDSMSIDSILTDTTKVLKSDLPVFFDSTEYLLHPVGIVKLHNSKYKSIGEYGEKLRDDYIYTYNVVYSSSGNYLRGNIANIVFEHIGTEKKHLLTKKVIAILDVFYLNSEIKKNKIQYFIYVVADDDTNNDGELDSDDVNSLYVSDIDGTGFEKISNKNHEFEKSKFINAVGRYYFSTIEDINKDGRFGKTDLFHYYYIDFTNTPYKVVLYNPIDMIGR